MIHNNIDNNHYFTVQQNVSISDDAYKAVVAFAGQNKIQAIKYIRSLPQFLVADPNAMEQAHSSLSLRAAKDIVEKIMADNGIIYTAPPVKY